MHTDQEIFEHAISVLAQFTAFSIERFHKTAELLLIKEHRSTVNEADALVHLTHVFSNQIGILANSYCSSLHALSQVSDKLDIIKTNMTTIFMEVRKYCGIILIISVKSLYKTNSLVFNRLQMQVHIFRMLLNC